MHINRYCLYMCLYGRMIICVCIYVYVSVYVCVYASVYVSVYYGVCYWVTLQHSIKAMNSLIDQRVSTYHNYVVIHSIHFTHYLCTIS